MALPTLIVVTGSPGSGKTTLAHALARAIPCPGICRDEIREGLVRTRRVTGAAPGDAIAHETYGAFFAAIEALLERDVSLVAEAAFQHELWAPKLEPLLERASLRVVVCRVGAGVARDRIARRWDEDPLRRRSHGDDVYLARMDRGEIPAYDPPHLDVPTLTVDTSDGYVPGFESVVAFART